VTNSAGYAAGSERRTRLIDSLVVTYHSNDFATGHD